MPASTAPSAPAPRWLRSPHRVMLLLRLPLKADTPLANLTGQDGRAIGQSAAVRWGHRVACREAIVIKMIVFISETNKEVRCCETFYCPNARALTQRDIR